MTTKDTTEGETMERYSKHAPTGFDPAGAFLDDRQDWYVVPVIQTRDSGPLDTSNFDNATEMLGGEGDDVEVHRFGHWGPGWYEIIIVRPDTPAAAAASKIESALDDYPVLNEEDFCQREHDEATETWGFYSIADRVELCQEAGVSVFAARHDYYPHDDQGRVECLLLGN